MLNLESVVKELEGTSTIVITIDIILITEANYSTY
jgi:hypothetical protein